VVEEAKGPQPKAVDEAVETANPTNHRARRRRQGQSIEMEERQRCQESFLAALKGAPNVVLASKIAGIHRSTAYEWYHSNQTFREGWDEALLEGAENLEAVAIDWAVQGVQEPVFHLGRVVGAKFVRSERMLELLLRAHMPWKYRPNYDGEAPPPGGSHASAQASANVAVFNIGGQVKRTEEMTEDELLLAERALRGDPEQPSGEAEEG